MPKHIQTADEFAQEISSGKVLLDFFATWCGPCNMLTPVIEELEKDRPDVKFIKVDVDELPELAAKFSVYSIPTLVYFENGEEKRKRLGYAPKAALEKFLNE